jgi:Uncharacterized homolog of PSP1
MSKMQDEVKALQLCQSKVRAKKLPMEVVDAEYQWYEVLVACCGRVTDKNVDVSGTDVN